MKEKMTNWMDLFVESINYILITYALSNMAMLFQHSVLFVLFLHLKYGLWEITGGRFMK